MELLEFCARDMNFRRKNIQAVSYTHLDVYKRQAELRVDGGPTRNAYLMQFQSDIANKRVNIPDAEELSGIGAAYMAGISVGLYDLEKLADNMKRSMYEPKMADEVREKKYAGWKEAVGGVLTK